MHFYVNGQKLTWLYGEGFYPGALPLGDVELRVELSANSHNPLAHDGEIIEAQRLRPAGSFMNDAIDFA